MLSRRRFLQASSLVSLSPVLPSILANTARAVGPDADARTLVVIQLDGGNDGINTVVPYADEAYDKAREKLRLEKDKLHKLDDRVGLHPDMRGAKELFDDGKLCVVQGVGYPNPDRSHFRSMRIWQTARFDDEQFDNYGWLASALDRKGANDAAANTIYVGDEQTPVALRGRRSSATTLLSADDLKLPPGLALASSRNDSGRESSAVAQFVSKQVLSAYASADQFERQQSTNKNTSRGDYPDTALGTRLKLVSQLLKSGSQSRVFYTVQSGYDTHSSQLYAHSRLLREFSAALKSFLADLKGAKLDDRVLVLAFSEFGRRVQENDSLGTDHGTAGPVFLAGTPVRGGLVGDAPNLADLDGGDLKMQFDFRQVYAAILDNWLAVPSTEILGGAFEKPGVLSV